MCHQIWVLRGSRDKRHIPILQNFNLIRWCQDIDGRSTGQRDGFTRSQTRSTTGEQWFCSIHMRLIYQSHSHRYLNKHSTLQYLLKRAFRRRFLCLSIWEKFKRSFISCIVWLHCLVDTQFLKLINCFEHHNLAYCRQHTPGEEDPQ